MNGPAIAALREKFEAIRQGELARGLARLPGAPPETRAAIEVFSIAIVNRILHSTTAKMFESPQERGPAWAAVVSDLFDLTGPAKDVSASEDPTPRGAASAAALRGTG